MKTSIFSQFSPVDGVQSVRYIICTSLLFVSTTGRGAASSEVAPAFFLGVIQGQGVAA
jgi:hypothetical protein